MFHTNRCAIFAFVSCLLCVLCTEIAPTGKRDADVQADNVPPKPLKSPFDALPTDFTAMLIMQYLADEVPALICLNKNVYDVLNQFINKLSDNNYQPHKHIAEAYRLSSLHELPPRKPALIKFCAPILQTSLSSELKILNPKQLLDQLQRSFKPSALTDKLILALYQYIRGLPDRKQFYVDNDFGRYAIKVILTYRGREFFNDIKDVFSDAIIKEHEDPVNFPTNSFAAHRDQRNANYELYLQKNFGMDVASISARQILLIGLRDPENSSFINFSFKVSFWADMAKLLNDVDKHIWAHLIYNKLQPYLDACLVKIGAEQLLQDHSRHYSPEELVRLKIAALLIAKEQYQQGLSLFPMRLSSNSPFYKFFMSHQLFSCLLRMKTLDTNPQIVDLHFPTTLKFIPIHLCLHLPLHVSIPLLVSLIFNMFRNGLGYTCIILLLLLKVIDFFLVTNLNTRQI